MKSFVFCCVLGVGALIAASPASATNHLQLPLGVAVDSAGNVYVADEGVGSSLGDVAVYNKSKKFLTTITAGMDQPDAVGVAFGGEIYVPNSGGSNVTVYNPDYSQNTGATISGGAGCSSFCFPTDLFVDAANDIWVIDGTHVAGYLDNGTQFNALPTAGAVTIGPWGSNLTIWGADGNGNEYFVNLGEAISGTVHDFPDLFGGGPVVIHGEAMDSIARQYAPDYNNNRVIVYDPTGCCAVTNITTAGPPWGVAVDNVNEHVYVSIPSLKEVQVFSTKTFLSQGELK